MEGEAQQHGPPLPLFPNNNVLLTYDPQSLTVGPTIRDYGTYRVNFNIYHDTRVLIEIRSDINDAIDYRKMLGLEETNVLKVYAQVPYNNRFSGFILENFDCTFQQYLINARAPNGEGLHRLFSIMMDFFIGLDRVFQRQMHLGEICETTFLVKGSAGRIFHVYESPPTMIDSLLVLSQLENYLRNDWGSWDTVLEKIRILIEGLNFYEHNTIIRIQPGQILKHPCLLSNEKAVQDFITTSYQSIEDGWKKNILLPHGNRTTLSDKCFDKIEAACKLVSWNNWATHSWTTVANNLASRSVMPKISVRRILNFRGGGGGQRYDDSELSFYRFARNYITHDTIDVEPLTRINTLQEIWPNFFAFAYWGLLLGDVIH